MVETKKDEVIARGHGNDHHYSNIDKILDELSGITNKSFGFLIPVLMYTAVSLFNLDIRINELTIGGIKLPVNIVAYIALLASCLFTTHLVRKLHFLKYTLKNSGDRFPDSSVAIRQHSWCINPFSQVVSDEPKELRLLDELLSPGLFFCI